MIKCYQPLISLLFLAEYYDDVYYEELYNLGTSHNTSKKDAVANNTSSSIADLKILLQRELDLVKNILLYFSKDDVNTMLEEDGYNIAMIEETYVLFSLI